MFTCLRGSLPGFGTGARHSVRAAAGTMRRFAYFRAAPLLWYLKRVGTTLRYDGVFAVALRLLAGCARPAGMLYMVRCYEKDLTKPPAAVPARAAIRVVEATEGDIDELAARVLQCSDRGREQGLDERKRVYALVRERLRKGQRCFVAKIDGRIVHYNWLGDESLNEPPRSFVALNGRKRDRKEIFVEDAFTAESWRGMGIHTAVQHEILNAARDAGYRYAYAVVPVQNRSSWKAHERNRWVLTAKVFYFRLHRTGHSVVWLITRREAKGQRLRFLRVAVDH
jgi:GNAT superfamily N-acetyltransferase